MPLSDYEKYHLHDYVCQKDDHYDKQEIDSKIKSIEDDILLQDGRIGTVENILSQPTEQVFYRGKCSHNNESYVEFYKDTDGINKGVNVKHSIGDFICTNEKKLKIVKKGLYTISYFDGWKCSQACNFRIKLNKILHDVNVNNFYVQKPLPTASSWSTLYFNITLEIAANTNLEMFLDNNNGILDGQSYSRISIFRLME